MQSVSFMISHKGRAKAQHGFSAIELVVVIAIAGALIVSAVGAGSSLDSNGKIRQAAHDVGLIYAAVSAYAATQGSTIAPVADATNELQTYLPGHLRVGGSGVNNIANPFGGTYVISVEATNFHLVISQVPDESTNRLVTLIARGGLRGGTITSASNNITVSGLRY